MAESAGPARPDDSRGRAVSIRLQVAAVARKSGVLTKGVGMFAAHRSR